MNCCWPNGNACTKRLNTNPSFSKSITINDLQLTTQQYSANGDAYWNGDTVSIPGKGSAKFTEKAGSYKRYNNRNWDVECIIEAGSPEGFKITLDNGVIYYFTQERVVSSLKHFNLIPVPLLPCGGSLNPCIPFSLPAESSEPDARVQYPQHFIFMLATRIEDRFGNWVSYSYNNDSQVTKITSNDNRTIDINYSSGRISSINANGKTWSYSYNDDRVGTLSAVVRPDGKRWTFAHDKTIYNSFWTQPNIAKHTQLPVRGVSCAESGSRNFIEMTHPEGMFGEFDLEEVCQGQSNVPAIRKLNPQGYSEESYWIPHTSNLFALSRKTLTLTDGEAYTRHSAPIFRNKSAGKYHLGI